MSDSSNLSNSVPDWLTGVWRRLSIEADGHKDTTTEVFWLQTHQCFGDIRIPGQRPDLPHKSSLTELTAAEAIALAGQQGFAGITELQASTCQWHRAIDYQPSSGRRDIGTLHWEGDLLIEVGVDAPYREEWQRIDDGNGDFTALVLPATGTSEGQSCWQGCVVTAGDFFIYAWNRSPPLPPADSLTELIAPNLQPWTALDCEISFGACRSGVVPWEIQRSTFPWREGQPLWSLTDLVVQPERGYLSQTVNATENEVRQWQIREWKTGLGYGDRSNSVLNHG